MALLSPRPEQNEPLEVRFLRYRIESICRRALPELAIELEDLVDALLDRPDPLSGVNRSMMSGSGASVAPQPSPLDVVAAREVTAALLPFLEELKRTNSNAVKTRMRQAIDEVLLRHGYPATAWRRKKEEA